MIEQVARALIAARRGGPRLSASWVKTLRLTADDAYCVQRKAAASCGPVGGFKFAQRPARRAIMAPIYAADIHASSAVAPSGGNPVGIELEVGFRINRQLPVPGIADFAERLRACVTPLAVIELVQTRLENPADASPELRLADNQMNGGLVLGTEANGWDGGALDTVTASLEFDGRSVLDGPVVLPFGDAFDCLCRLAAMIGDHCGGLQSGQIVITGSLNGLPYVAPGTCVRGTIDGIGEVGVVVSS